MVKFQMYGFVCGESVTLVYFCELNDDVDDDDDDDESLNEDDDYEEDDINDDEDIPHLIMCQFDYVRFISSLLHIHNNDGVIKPILFN